MVRDEEAPKRLLYRVGETTRSFWTNESGDAWMIELGRAGAVHSGAQVKGGVLWKVQGSCHGDAAIGASKVLC